VGIVFGAINESVVGFLDLFILGFYNSIGGRGESYGFSKMGLESVTILIARRSLFGLQN